MFNEHNIVEAVAAVMRIPGTPTSNVDNFHSGGLACALDITSGRLHKATYHGLNGKLERYSKHPTDHYQIEDFVLPNWNDAISLCIKSHHLFDNRLLIGWDICFSARGIIFIEANGQPCTDFIQRAYNMPITKMRMGEIFQYYLSLSN
jgi:hypothetical protein